MDEIITDIEINFHECYNKNGILCSFHLLFFFSFYSLHRIYISPNDLHIEDI
jgi:hypothetical protein